ncbi:cobyric acid synthase [Halanaerobacter jeridensis]|uniref:Cobyric acid synthase n=1 Tax=Halanaerobacter jeridensis TaxID=706427 RepID=A0A938XSW4_9FIRM|nr:cobyric acid synthase [Halanaerobacter jeridensis]MBM7557116.1 adenosylcobyric acid synthase [Halanaerobacter jeridensis]
MTKSIMIQGTASNVGKSILTIALCRILTQDGYQVAPFKSWNMALNSYVTNNGAEIGRAQAVQADAAGIDATADMQPLLVKPKGEGQAQVIVRGSPRGDFGVDRKNQDYINWALEVIDDSLTALSQQFEALVLEGAGSPAEINMKEQDLANMKVAKLKQTPVLLVADVNRGGALAAVVGTLKLLEPADRDLVQGIVLNKFRGDFELLEPGIEFLEEKTGKPVVGVLPYCHDIKIPDEDSVSLANLSSTKAEIKIAVINLPHLSNFTDFDALALEPKVEVDYVSAEADLSDYEAVIIPGTKNTTADLKYLKDTGLAAKIIKAAEDEIIVVGICGGYQILGQKLLDPNLTEGDDKALTGLGLLDLETTFREEKATHQVQAAVNDGYEFCSAQKISGYEIHMGQTQRGAGVEPLLTITERSGEKVTMPDGAVNQANLVWGTYLHGIFDNDQFRREWINYLRQQKGLAKLAGDSIEQRKELEASYDALAEMVRENLDLELLYRIMEK